MADSSVAGILTPSNSIIDDKDIDLVFVDYIKQTGDYDDGMVRREFQEVNGKQPEWGVDWASVMVKTEDIDNDPTITHYPEGEGYSELMRNELVEVRVAFYGNNAKKIASQVRDSFHISQNHWWFKNYNMTFKSMGKIIPVHDFHNNLWHKRYDLTFKLNRCIIRRYEILNILSVTVDFNGNEINA